MMRRVVFHLGEFPHGLELDSCEILRCLGADYVFPRTWIVEAGEIVPLFPGYGLTQPRGAAVAECLEGDRTWGNSGWVAYDGVTLLHRAAETGQCIHALMWRLREGAPIEPPVGEEGMDAESEYEALMVEDVTDPNVDCCIWFCDGSVAIVFIEDEERADILERYARREL